jgi:parallel beta-helix repeat protein
LSINASNNTITNNQVYGNCGEGIFLTQTSNQNRIYNNIFVDDALDYGENIWNVSKIQHVNIVNGPFISGNYWANYNGRDMNDDGIGDTKTPYNSSGNIHVGGDYAPLLDQIQLQQSFSDRGFPIRHAVDGDWGAAQNFTHNVSFLSRISVLVRKFGNPEFNLTIELRQGSVKGNLSRKITFLPNDISLDWQWLNVNFDDFIIPEGTDYFIVLPPTLNNTSSSFGYEWAYAFGNQYADGSFWFTRDGGSLWRDLPTMYEFTFWTYGY